MRRLAPAALLVLAAGGAAAQDAAPPSCSLTGQIATTAWLNTAAAVGRGDAAQVEAATALLDRMTATHERLGCDMEALAGVFDCILSDTGTQPARDTARRCLIVAGLVSE